jgi:predicted nucleic acid-binding protein
MPRSAWKTHGHWDAAILEAGRSLGCEVVLSEDLSHGQEYGGIRVEDPFGGVTSPPRDLGS